MAWYDFFLTKGSQSQDYLHYISAVLYGLIFLSAIVFWVILSRRTRKDKTEIVAYKTVSLVYIGVLVAVSILSLERFIALLTPYGVNGNPSMLITIVGYTIILYAFNLFLLLTVHFRKRTKKIITFLASFEVSLIVIIDLIVLLSVFYELPTVVEDFAVIILGAVVMMVVIFTIVNIAIEIRKTANKMTKIKLSAALVGIIGFLLDGFSNLLNIVLVNFEGLDTFRDIYITYMVPIMALFFYGMVIIGFYYSLYPPEWLQRKAGVLPPKFTDIMKTQSTTKEQVQ